MCRTVLPTLALAIVPFLAASAQESLCNPCVDVPVNLIRRDDFTDPTRTNETVIIRAEDMRNLGIISVSDMIMQLRNGVAAAESPYDRPISLGDANAFPVQFAAVFSAAADHLQSLEHMPGEFNARLIMCPEGTCTLVVYPAALGDASAMTVRECPDGYCATIVFSQSENRIVEVRD